MGENRALTSDVFAFAFEHSPIAKAVVSLDGRFVHVNEQFCRLAGRSKDVLLGLTWMDITPPEELAGTLAMQDVLMQGGTIAGQEREYEGPDGTSVWAVTYVQAIPGRDGAPDAFLIQLVDVSESKRRELQRLQETNERLVDAQRLAHLGSWEFDAHTNSVTWSEETYRQVGVPDGIPMTFPDFVSMVHPDDRHLILEPPASGSFEFEMRIIRPDGAIRWLLSRGEIVEEHGTVARVIGTSLDITDRKAAEDATRRALERERELARAKDAFLTAVSHELRTPLTSIIGYVDLLVRRFDQLTVTQQKDFLTRMSANVSDLEFMLSEILDVDRLSRGVLEPRRRTFELGGVVAKCLARSRVTQRHAVHTEIAEVLVDLDPAWVERIVDHLLANAAKHTPAGTRVTLRVMSVDDDVRIEVEDNGPGISEAVRAQIFEPFSLGPTAPSHAPGMGLGLTLVRQLAEAQGGRALIEDVPGGGVRFIVALPRYAHA